MRRPYIDWDPAENRELVLARDGGPYVFTADDHQTLRKLVTFNGGPRSINYDSPVHAIQRLRFAAGSPGGVIVDQWPVMPNKWGYAGHPSGEPEPQFLCNNYGSPYTRSGARLPLRGYLATGLGGIETSIAAKWTDALLRDAPETPVRGAWTGVVLSALNLTSIFPGSHVDFYSVHGKRAGDTGWKHRGGDTFTTAESIAVANDIFSSGNKVVVDPGPLDDITVRALYESGGWQPLHTTANGDATQGGAHAAEDIAAVAALVQGGAAVYGGYPPADPQTRYYFTELELAQFEPFVMNKAVWEYRDFLDAFNHLYLFPFPPPYAAFGSTVYSYPDLIHPPLGSTHAPLNLRVNDPDLGWCVEMGQDSYLLGYGADEFWPVDTQSPTELCTSDPWTFTDDAPFAFAIRLKLEGASFEYPEKNIFSFGDVYQRGSNFSNGIGIAIQVGFINVRYWDNGFWNLLQAQVSPEVLSSAPLDLAVAWTGADGDRSGYGPRILRLLVNGRTVAAVETSGVNQYFAGTARAFIGHSPESGPYPGFEGKFRRARVWCYDLSDDELRRAFDDAESPVVTSGNFDEPAADGAPGEAEGWTWSEHGSENPLAAFRSSPWATPEEEFGWGDEAPSVTFEGPTWDLRIAVQHSVGAVTPAPSNRIILYNNDYRQYLRTGCGIRIQGSTGLDGYWTVSSFWYAGSHTYIETVEDILTTTADGLCEIPRVADFSSHVFTGQWAQFWDIWFDDPAAVTADELALVLNSYLQHTTARARGDNVTLRSNYAGSTVLLQWDFEGNTGSDWGVDDVGIADTWDDVSAIAAVFAEGSDIAGTAETFFWFEQYDDFESAGPVEAEFLSYYEVLNGVGVPRVLPRDADTFGEGWNDDPLSLPVGDWYSPQQRNGRIYGDPVSFPLQIKANRDQLWAWDYSDPTNLYEVAVTSGIYDTPAALLTDLQTLWAAQFPLSPNTFGAEEQPDGTYRIWLGWDGVTAVPTVAAAQLYAGPNLSYEEGAREALGFNGTGPNDTTGEIRAPEEAIEGTSPPWDESELYGSDKWTLASYSLYAIGGGHQDDPIWPGLQPAIFDVSIGSPQGVELIDPAGWGGALIDPLTYVWTDDCLFDTDVGPGELFEDFEEGW